MTEQFRHFDAPKRAQVITIEWERLTPRDDSGDTPEERDDGFWPSADPAGAGYVGADNVANLPELKAQAEERLQAWRNDEWEYVGVIARAHIAVPIGGDSFCTYTMDSPGTWGIESDAGDYLDEVFEDQKRELQAHLEIMGAHFGPYGGALSAGVVHAKRVAENWSSGDLARAVNGLDEWATDVATDFPDLDVSDDEEEEEGDVSRPYTAEEAAAVRGLHDSEEG